MPWLIHRLATERGDMKQSVARNNAFSWLAILCATMTQAYAHSISLTNTQAMSFGSFAAGTGGSVTISATGVRTRSGAVTLLSSNPGQVAQFEVKTSQSSLGYNVTLPTSASLTGPGSPMTLTAWTTSPVTNGCNTDNSGQQILSVGGTLAVGNNQAAGSYNTTFSITVNLP